MCKGPKLDAIKKCRLYFQHNPTCVVNFVSKGYLSIALAMYFRNNINEYKVIWRLDIVSVPFQYIPHCAMEHSMHSTKELHADSLLLLELQLYSHCN